MAEHHQTGQAKQRVGYGGLAKLRGNGQGSELATADWRNCAGTGRIASWLRRTGVTARYTLREEGNSGGRELWWELWEERGWEERRRRKDR